MSAIQQMFSSVIINRKTICDIKHGQHSQLTAYENHPQYEWIACFVFNFNLDLSSKCPVHLLPTQKI